jgi:transposase InsO family protein
VRYQALATIPSPLALGRRCALLAVSRSGFYAWRRRPVSRRAEVNQRLVAEMQVIHREVDRTYGSPRMAPELVGRGLPCGRHRVARLMRAHGIRAKQARRFRVTTDSQHGYAVAPNHLARQFTVPAPNRVWMGDVTYVPTAEGWCYLAVLLDAFSRRVVGWALGTQLTATLPLVALRRALAARRPAPGVLHHSDRGIQYVSTAYQAALHDHGLEASMSRRGDCWDNAVVESFFHTLKVERLHERRYATREQLQQDVEDYIERFYNRQRRHSTLGHLSPAMFELLHAA